MKKVRLREWITAIANEEGGLTTPMAKLLEQLLRETIERGTGENMAALAEWVIQTFRQHHAELPKLRAYTWAAHILGQRILRGEFGDHAKARRQGVERIRDERDHAPRRAVGAMRGQRGASSASDSKSTGTMSTPACSGV